MRVWSGEAATVQEILDKNIEAIAWLLGGEPAVKINKCPLGMLDIRHMPSWASGGIGSRVIKR